MADDRLEAPNLSDSLGELVKPVDLRKAEGIGFGSNNNSGDPYNIAQPVDKWAEAVKKPEESKRSWLGWLGF